LPFITTLRINQSLRGKVAMFIGVNSYHLYSIAYRKSREGAVPRLPIVTIRKPRITRINPPNKKIFKKNKIFSGFFFGKKTLKIRFFLDFSWISEIRVKIAPSEISRIEQRFKRICHCVKFEIIREE